MLDHDPTLADSRRFLARVRDAITCRNRGACPVRGVTTDGSPLYPEALAAVFPGVRHQVCEFHVLKEITKAVLRVLARRRKHLAAQVPALPRGRPRQTPAAQRVVRRAKAIRERVGALFEHRHLFVRRHLTPAERRTLATLTGRDAQLRALRAIMEEVYRLFDRRCRTDTALAKLAVLRRRLTRERSLGRSLDKLRAPSLEKALTFLDDKQLPATSNAVERGNRRHRKAQKTIYRVRTRPALEGRLALDLQRDRHASTRAATLHSLHVARALPA